LHIARRWLLFLFASLLPYAAGARATTPEWALLAEARVTGESIYLSDLLPAGISPELREAAGKISLGAAPPPGGTLTLEGSRIARLLPAATRDEILIPPQVLVHRSSRPLSREEVVTAIRAALRYNKLPGGADLDSENVHFPAATMVSAVDAQLKVRRADFDAALNQARFLLVSAADRRALPFLVTVERPSAPRGDVSEGVRNSPGVTGNLESPFRDTRLATVASGEPSLVEPRRLAKLHVFSGNMQMFLEVVPLEKGALHDLVRVKLPGNGQILRGRVVAPGQLEAQF
jgi:hypothetical protein